MSRHCLGQMPFRFHYIQSIPSTHQSLNILIHQHINPSLHPCQGPPWAGCHTGFSSIMHSLHGPDTTQATFLNPYQPLHNNIRPLTTSNRGSISIPSIQMTSGRQFPNPHSSNSVSLTHKANQEKRKVESEPGSSPLTPTCRAR